MSDNGYNGTSPSAISSAGRLRSILRLMTSSPQLHANTTYSAISAHRDDPSCPLIREWPSRGWRTARHFLQRWLTAPACTCAPGLRRWIDVSHATADRWWAVVSRAEALPFEQ